MKPTLNIGVAAAESRAVKEPQKELRLGLVLYGGVSLAVYIYGVVLELYRIIQASEGADENAWSELLRKANATFAVDIVSGTSAGGINGILLGKALTENADLEDVKPIWTDEADFSKLLQSTGKSEPHSLLQSKRFEELLRDGLAKLDRNPSEPPRRPLVGTFDLFVASTRVRPWIRGFPTDLGTSIETKDYRKVFELKYRQRTYRRNDFGADANPRLVQVARATSAFPVAFEPIEIAHAENDPQFASDEPPRSHFTDGGVLHNKPFTETIETIAARSADLPVRRWLVSVEPDPEEPSPEAEDLAPDAAEVLSKSAFGIPRYQSIAADLERLDQHRKKAEGTRAALDDIDHFVGLLVAEGRPLGDDGGEAGLSSALSGSYENERRRAFAIDMSTRLSSWLSLPPFQAKQLNQELQLRATASDFLQFPEGDVSRERRCVQRLLERIAQGAPLNGADELRRYQQELWRASEEIGDLYWQSLTDLIPESARAGSRSAVVAAEIASELEARLDEGLQPIRNRVDELCEEIDGTFPPAVPVAPFTAVHRHFEIWDWVLLTGASDDGSVARDDIRLARISPRDAIYVRKPVAEKLAGDALGHFGGFIKREWRKNDLLWGRLDAAEIAIRMLFADDHTLDRAEIGELIEAAQREIVAEELPEAPIDDYRRYLEDPQKYNVGGESLGDVPMQTRANLAVRASEVVRNLFAELGASATGEEKKSKQMLLTAYGWAAKILTTVLLILRWPVLALWGHDTAVRRGVSVGILFAGLWSILTWVLLAFDLIEASSSVKIAAAVGLGIFLVYSLLRWKTRKADGAG